MMRAKLGGLRRASAALLGLSLALGLSWARPRLAHADVKACIEHGSPKKIERMDGAKIWLDEETWLMVRPSGTEPLIRMYAESTDKSLLESKVEEYSRIVRSKMS